MSINGINGSGGTSGVGASSGVSKSTGLDFTALFKALKEEASKTPEQRARDKVLEKHELTEESYQALPSDKRVAIDAEIREAVKRAAEQRRAGMTTERMA